MYGTPVPRAAYGRFTHERVAGLKALFAEPFRPHFGIWFIPDPILAQEPHPHPFVGLRPSRARGTAYSADHRDLIALKQFQEILGGANDGVNFRLCKALSQEPGCRQIQA